MVFRPIKEKRRKTIPVPPLLVAELREPHRLQVMMADQDWGDHDLMFSQWNGRPIGHRDALAVPPEGPGNK